MQKFFTSALAQKTIRVSDVPANHVDKHPKNSFSSVSYGVFRSPNEKIQIMNPQLRDFKIHEA